MKKEIYKSKTVIGLVVALLAAVYGVWVGESEISTTIGLAGLGFAGYGLRDAIK